MRTVAFGGVYVGGGIAPEILPRFETYFFCAFCGKSKFAEGLARVPLSVVVNEDAPVWGAAYQALGRVDCKS